MRQNYTTSWKCGAVIGARFVAFNEAFFCVILHDEICKLSAIYIVAQTGLVSSSSCRPAGLRPQQHEMAIGIAKWQTGGGERRRNTAGGRTNVSPAAHLPRFTS